MGFVERDRHIDKQRDRQAKIERKKKGRVRGKTKELCAMIDR